MGSNAPSEGGWDDDDGDFLEAAQRDDALVAELLIRLSHSGTLALPAKEPPRPLLPPEPAWGRKGKRTRTITLDGVLATNREEAGRASPTTPLSWSGGSGSSGSVCAGVPRRPRRRRKNPGAHEHGVLEQKHLAAETRIRAPPAKRQKLQPFHNGGRALAPLFEYPEMETTSEEGGDSLVLAAAAAAAVGSSASSGSNKVVGPAVGKVRERPAARVEPLRLILTAEGTSSEVLGRPGKKKKTFSELQAMCVSLLQEQECIRKELEKQEEIYYALLEENMKLKELESGSPTCHIDSKPTSTHGAFEEAEHEQPQHVPSISEPQPVEGPSIASAAPEEEKEEERPGKSHCTSSSSSAPGRMFLLDLNCLPDADL